MNYKCVIGKYIGLLYLILFFTNCKKETVPTNKIRINQPSIVISVNEKKNIEYYRNEIENAVTLVVKQKKIIDIELNENERVEIIAIAFPEIIRYNAFSDLIETTSNRLLYINGGKIASDFSIGIFQMKPSFVENLENYVANCKKLQQYKNIQIRIKNQEKTREERINRLENFHWQLYYLKVFWAVMEEKYSHILFKNKIDKLRFYATAYNFGFQQPEKKIINYQKTKAFPYGKDKTKAVRFADFSIDFYNKYDSLIKP